MIGVRASSGSKLVCASADSADGYRTFLRTAFADRAPQERLFIGRPVVAFQSFG